MINKLEVAEDRKYDFDFEDVDMSAYSDPSETYDPEFFSDYDKKYEDPDKTYYGETPFVSPSHLVDDDDDPSTDFDPMENVGIIPGPNDLPSKKKKKTTAPIYSQ